MSDFFKALLATAIPIVALSLISIVLRVSVIGPAIAVAIVVAIIFAASGRRNIANGILAGIGIGFVVQGVTCFAVLFGQ